jgi:hypothetical protein
MGDLLLISKRTRIRLEMFNSVSEAIVIDIWGTNTKNNLMPISDSLKYTNSLDHNSSGKVNFLYVKKIFE